ncbi:MAG: HutD family protein [Burkholderiaceae bacterium]
MKLLHQSELASSPWRNGGGVTREVAVADHDGQMVWRLSLATVSSDGAFSRFDGYRRILTVVRGAGMRLHMPDRVLRAEPGVPVGFSGAEPVDGSLVGEEVQNLNLIYDPARVVAAVRKHEATEQGACLPELSIDKGVVGAVVEPAVEPSVEPIIGLYCQSGSAKVNHHWLLDAGTFALPQADDAPLTSVELTPASIVFSIRVAYL